MISHQYLNPQKATHPPSGGVGHIVAVFQIVAALAGNQGFAEAAGFQGRQIIFGAVNLVRLIQSSVELADISAFRRTYPSESRKS